MTLQYFKIEEFACPCGREECDAPPIDMELCLKLDGLRRELNLPIKINSGTRCKYQNGKVGGEPDSQHMLGRAADVHCPDGGYMRRLVILALKHGFTGIGVMKRAVHLDIRDSGAVLFGYEN